MSGFEPDLAFPGVIDRAQQAVRQTLRSLLPWPVGHVGEEHDLVEALRAMRTDEWPEVLRTDLLDALPGIRHAVELDVGAAYAGDPACRSQTEAALCMPGVQAVTVHRLAHWLWRHGLQRTGRMLSEQIRSATAIDIHPGASIGPSFLIDHGVGVVIGETSTIGDHVKIYQGVTLGALSTERAKVGDRKRHPTVEDHVTIYANATILGGETVVGAGCVIGAGVFLTRSVPARHVVRNPLPTVEVRKHEGELPLTYMI